MKKLLVLFALSAFDAFAAAESSSGRLFVHIKPEMDSFWRTATNSTVSLPVDYPEGAKSATLKVTGDAYRKFYADVPPGMFDVEFPSAESPDTENVYELELVFDNGIVRTASLTVVEGVLAGAEGASRCLLSGSGYKWSRVMRRAVLPVAYNAAGSSLLTVNGQTEDTGLDGAAGWYLFGNVEPGRSYSLELVSDSSVLAAELKGRGAGVAVRAR